MKKIVLHSLTERNFKGIKNFTLNTNGEDVSVLGDNATGKTSQFDAFTWLLFGKDSQNKTEFGIKTLVNGEPVHHLEHEVEGVLLIDGKRKTLRKVFAEKWTKKRGSATSEFTGHETNHFIDGVPVSKGEYTTFIDNIISEDLFKLLTSPSYFNQMHWTKRRNTLLDVCGNISDVDVVDSNPSLAALSGILGDHSIDDYRKIINARRTEINKELVKVPVRIDELQRSLPDVGDSNEEFLADDIASLKKRIEEKEGELSRIQTGGEIAVKEKRQRELEGELLQIKNKAQSGTLDQLSAQRNAINALHSQQGDLRRGIQDCEGTIAQNTRAIERGKIERARLLEQHNRIKSEEFETKHDENCPTCGQSLPADQVESAHTKALAAFNLRKSEQLESIAAQGKANKTECMRLESVNARIVEAIAGLEQQLEDKKQELWAAEDELELLQSGLTDVSTDPDYMDKQLQIEEIKKELVTLRSSNLSNVEAVRKELMVLRADVGTLEQQQTKFIQIKSAKHRLDELTRQEKSLADEYAKLEGELFLTEEFVRCKVAMLESKINSKFKIVRFKLFGTQVNGGLEECCDTLVGGVPYGAGLNNAAEINAGLDIINTLSEHYGFTAPIFIDNAEAVTRLIPTVGQQISLIVSEQDKQLRVENNEMKEAV